MSSVLRPAAEPSLNELVQFGFLCLR